MTQRFSDGNHQEGGGTMEMARLGEQHRRISRLGGVWTGEETLHPSPWSPGGKRMGRYEYRIICGGFFLAGDYVQRDGDQVAYEGHAVFGVEPKSQETTWYWVDSMGVPGPAARGKWEGETLTLLGKTEEGAVHGRYTFAFDGERHVRFKIENTQDGGQSWRTFMEGDYRKQ
jgi:hypothetical protein